MAVYRFINSRAFDYLSHLFLINSECNAKTDLHLHFMEKNLEST